MAKRTSTTGSTKYEPRHLGKVSNTPSRELDVIAIKRASCPDRVTLKCAEFTSHCPVTHQPDYAQITITYLPDKLLVETKSVKLYLQSFRHYAAFNEIIVSEIARDFFTQLKPCSVQVTGEFNQRGGIAITTSKYLSKE